MKKSSKKKIAPRYREYIKPERVFYGNNSNTWAKGYNKKTTFICSNPECGYSTRVWIAYGMWGLGSSSSNKHSCSSQKCPKHGDTLVNIGNGSKVPKKGSKLRKELIKKYK